MQKLPTGLQIVCILAILFGTMGFGAAGFGVVGALFGEAMQQAFTPQVPANNPMAKRQEEIQKEIMAESEKWAAVNYSLFAVLFVVAGCLIFGGVQALRMQPGGPKLLMIAFLLAIVFELVRLIPTISIQLATIDIMERFFADALKAPAGGRPLPPAMRRMTQNMMTGAMYMGFAISGIWLLVKLGFYSFGIWYLRRPAIRQLGEPAAELDWSDSEPA